MSHYDDSTSGTASPTRLMMGVAAFALVLAAAAAQAGGAAAGAPQVAFAQDDIADGAQVFAENCASCHQLGGTGIVGRFPPLAGNPSAADPVYVEGIIRNGLSGPVEILGVSYDDTMDPFPDLSEDDLAAVVAYVGSIAGRDPSASSSTVPAPAEPGDVDEGRALFVGSDRLENGGAACASCHTAGNVGNLGGWSLGPDLTDTHESFGGDAGLSAWLSSPASPTMRPIFGDRPMTEPEIADVVAFLGDAPSQSKPTDPGDGLILAGAGGLSILMVGMAIAWRGMRQTYAERLRSKR